MKTETKEKIYRFIIKTMVCNIEKDTLKFHNFYYYSKYGKKLIDHHTYLIHRMLISDSGQYQYGNLHLLKLLFYHCNVDIWSDGNNNFQVIVNTLKGFDDRFEVVEEGFGIEKTLTAALQKEYRWARNYKETK